METTRHSHPELLGELLEALGGPARIASVTSYAREAVLESGDAPHGEAGRAGSVTFFSRVWDRLRTDACHEITFRTAPGRVRVEVLAVDATAASGAGALLAVAGPNARHEDRPGTHGAGGPADCTACAGAAVLREAAYEPRNLLAHAAQRGAMPVEAADGGIEIALAREGIVYRFDRRTRLCAQRIDGPGGRSTQFREWQRVGGVATPFLEIEEAPSGAFERRVLAVAYDLPWPDRLFRAPAW